MTKEQYAEHLTEAESTYKELLEKGEEASKKIVAIKTKSAAKVILYSILMSAGIAGVVYFSHDVGYLQCGKNILKMVEKDGWEGVFK